MIARDDITRKLPAMANHGLLEPFDQPLPVRTIADNLLPRISPRGASYCQTWFLVFGMTAGFRTSGRSTCRDGFGTNPRALLIP
jgi:hypothetical protein